MDNRALAIENGLSDQEYDAVVCRLNRESSLTEIGIVSAMWSEHCSYRSSKPHLRKIFSTGAQVVEGPGENAGVIDIGDDLVAVFKMESHNHPSFLEPYQGAATGVGGIMRDIFTMGARPIAFLNALRFGAPDHPKTRHLVEGVVSGIGGYGNCVGVPTVGGEVDFDPSYNGNILVNAMCVGIAERRGLFRSQLEAGCKLIYVGARTGRDGIRGAVMASASFDGDEVSRTSIQIGDPFMQKLLLESCLEMMQTDAIIGLQDMGAAGLTSASVEMAEKSRCGVFLHLDKVPCREADMSAYEIMLSESQERMLIAIHADAEETVRAICDKWDVSCVVIGEANDSEKLQIKYQDRLEVDLPIDFLVHDAPELSRPVKTPPPPPPPDKNVRVDLPAMEVLKKLLSTAELCSRRWVAEQYDRTVMGDTLAAGSGDAALVRVHGTKKALALTTEATPRYCQADPYQGAKQAVAECFRNIIAVGATPLATTDCLNFASPEDENVMGQFAAAIQGMSEAAQALNMPIVSGNVSFYNETDGRAIIPTPAIGAVGLVEDYAHAVSFHMAKVLMKILMVGNAPTKFSGMSLYEKYMCDHNTITAPPPVDLKEEQAHGVFVRDQILAGRIKAAHDIGSGGLAVAVAEMAIASDQGIILTGDHDHAFYFSEDQARYVIACDPADLAALEKAAQQNAIPLTLLGESGGAALTFHDQSVPLSVLGSLYESFLPNLMETQNADGS